MTWTVRGESRRNHSQRVTKLLRDQGYRNHHSCTRTRLQLHRSRLLQAFAASNAILSHPSTRAIVSDCFGDGSFTLSRPCTSSPHNSRGLNIGSSVENHSSHAPTGRQTRLETKTPSATLGLSTSSVRAQANQIMYARIIIASPGTANLFFGNGVCEILPWDFKRISCQQMKVGIRQI